MIGTKWKQGRSSHFNFKSIFIYIILFICQDKYIYLYYPFHMPRQARIDAPGALHHIIARGNEKRKIFEDKPDRQQFLARLGDILSNTETACYAWALIPNHALC